jgi:hypothetical protein
MAAPFCFFAERKQTRLASNIICYEQPSEKGISHIPRYGCSICEVPYVLTIKRKSMTTLPKRRREDIIKVDLWETGLVAWTRFIWLRTGTTTGRLGNKLRVP